MKILRAGTRGSQLALCQTKLIARQLEAADPDLRVEPVVIRTKGDRMQDRSLAEAGGKGLFIQELEETMLQGNIDFAVHSGKDLPAVTPEPFCFPAVSEREDPSDLLLSLPGREISIVGTSSPRRTLMIERLYPDCTVELLRGNVTTRLEKLRSEEYDAIIVAAAGVKRLGLDLSDLSVRKLTPAEMVPAACQGIMACEAVSGSETAKILSLIDHKRDHVLFNTERLLMQLLGADCHDAVGVYSEYIRNNLKVCAFFEIPEVRETTIHAGHYEEELKAFAEELSI